MNPYNNKKKLIKRNIYEFKKVSTKLSYKETPTIYFFSTNIKSIKPYHVLITTNLDIYIN